jgi:hypothetical protein
MNRLPFNAICVFFVTSSLAQIVSAADWQAELTASLPLLGHRNWVAIVDSAYPLQTAPGVKLIYAGGDQIEAVKAVFKAIDDSKHVRPVVFIDRELKYVPEQRARGIGNYREKLKQAFIKRSVSELPHDEIIEQIDEAGQTFRVLLIKTDLTLPYTSVFIRLDAGYWSAEDEKELRAAMDKD